MKNFLLVLTTLFFSSLGATTVVVIGGGPGGLATAIEAYYSGADVIIVEKRKDYTRNQGTYLLDSSLALLEKWEVHVEHMYMGEITPERKVAFLQLKNLEKALGKKVELLGIQKIHGEFLELCDHAIVVQIEGEEKVLSYDFLVAADGAHSHLRDCLHIKTSCIGQARGALAVFGSLEEDLGTIHFTPDLKNGDIHGKRSEFDGGSVVCLQGPSNSLGDFCGAIRDFGWQEDANKLADGQGQLFENIEVLLQRSDAFFNREYSAILIGDAAATGSFFRGLGANTALKAATFAGRFFREVEIHEDLAYDSFNQKMQEVTDYMIERNRSLF